MQRANALVYLQDVVLLVSLSIPCLAGSVSGNVKNLWRS